MYAKIIDNKIAYTCNLKTESDMVEMPENLQYPVVVNNAIIEGYSESLQLFKNDVITETQFFYHIQDITLKVYKKLWSVTDEYIAMKEKRTYLDIWTPDDEAEFNQVMSDYEKLVLEYKGMKNTCLSLAGNKYQLINYYIETLLPRLEELK